MSEESVVQQEVEVEESTSKKVLHYVLAGCATALVAGFLMWLAHQPADPDIKAPQVFSPILAARWSDDGDAAHLVASHPALAKVCAMAGGCDAVTARYWPPESAQNQGKPLWNIRVPGATDNKDVLTGLCGVGETLDEAAEDFVNSYRKVKAQKAYK